MLLQNTKSVPFLTPFRFSSSFPEARRIHEAFDRLLHQAGQQRPTEYPPINTWTNGEGALVTADLPGISAADLDLSIEHNTLTLKGARSNLDHKDDQRWHRRERWHGQFVRSLELPFEVAIDQISADFKDGRLVIHLPKADAEKPKHIAINGS